MTVLRALKPESQARSLESIHFALWVLIPRRHMAKLFQRKGQGPCRTAQHEMLFLSEFSGGWEDYLVSFNEFLISALDLAWGTSLDWRPLMQVSDYLDFVRRYELQSQHHYQAYGAVATVQDVRDALQLSERLDRFVWHTRGLDAEQFAAAYTQLRIELGSCLVG